MMKYIHKYNDNNFLYNTNYKIDFINEFDVHCTFILDTLKKTLYLYYQINLMNFTSEGLFIILFCEKPNGFQY